MFDRSTFRDLLGPAGQRILQEAQRAGDDLRGLSRLRRRFPADLATLAHLTIHLRKRAACKFARADAMYFLPEALEQATGEVVARHKARRFAGRENVVDLGCGIGGDTLALAARAPVAAFERDGLRAAMARANLRVHAPAFPAHVVQADFTVLGPEASAFHWDPARRAGGRRVRAGDAFVPPLSLLPALLERIPDGGLCVGPATPDREIPLAGAFELEAISHAGECKALILWTGTFRTASRRATLLPAGRTLTGDGAPSPGPVSAPRGYLVLPDPAVVRAHLVRELAERIGAALLDPHLSLLTAETVTGAPWTRCFRVLAEFPFSRRRLRRELAARKLARVQISRHGVALRAADIQDGSRHRGPVEARVFLVRGNRGVAAVITPFTAAAG